MRNFYDLHLIYYVATVLLVAGLLHTLLQTSQRKCETDKITPCSQFVRVAAARLAQGLEQEDLFFFFYRKVTQCIRVQASLGHHDITIHVTGSFFRLYISFC